MKKLLRIVTVIFLAFGWLFMAPIEAHSDDPITIGAQRIEALNQKVSDLNDSADLISLIDIAQDKYDDAVIARDNKLLAEQAYELSMQDGATALSQLNTANANVISAQSAVDEQLPIKNTANTNKNSAKEALDIANINLSNAQYTLSSAGSQGVSFQIYPLTRDWYGNAYIAEGSGLMCQGSIYSFNIYAGSGAICGLHDNIIGIFRATLTLPDEIDDVYFAGATDDGFKLYVNGVLATSQWIEQGTTWSPYTQHYNTSVDKTLQLEAWWYNGGGPGNMHIGYGYNGIWTGINPDYLSYGTGATQEQINAYNTAVSNQSAAQINYNNKLSIYNQENTKLVNLQSALSQAQQNKNSKQTIYENSQTNISNKLTAKNNATNIYNKAVSDMNDAITAAEEEYIAQWDFEEKQRINAAIAQAAANAAANQPTPEPTPEAPPTPVASPDPTPEAPPTPKPTAEPTPEAPPTPAPSPEPTPEAPPTPKPTPEATVDPTPEPTPAPTPEPTVEPAPSPEPTPEPTKNPDIKDEILAALIPEKGTGTTEDLSGVIANLTSKDNKLVKLSAEQVAAVSQTLKALTVEAKAEVAKDLGIAPSEVTKVADLMKSDPAVASAFVEFADRAGDSKNAPMPFTLADAVTEVQTEAFLADPIGAVLDINPAELLSNFSELGMDMTDDQREKAQEVIVPVIIASQIAGAVMRRIN